MASASTPTGEPRELAGGEVVLDFPADAVARLTLNNPGKRNPLSHAVLDAITETLPLLDHGIDVRCVVVTGAGKAFSAGYDIGAIPDETFERDAEALVAHPFTAARSAPIPSRSSRRSTATASAAASSSPSAATSASARPRPSSACRPPSSV